METNPTEVSTVEQAEVAVQSGTGDAAPSAIPALPSLEPVAPLAREKAARIIERCGYEITGYTLTHRAGTRKAIVDGTAIRWFPDAADFERMLRWKEPVGPATPPDSALGDPLLVSGQAGATSPAPVAPTVQRAVLAAPPSLPLLDTVEDALGAIAAELGCVRNDTVPHNAGWFVPGRSNAFASALDAIRALFGSLKAGGTVYTAQPRPSTESSAPARVGKVVEAESHEQAALF
ncbi:hypothetical protein AB4Y43_17095 [Paraburkholderia sp. BR10872]|uniref:hypothetical protein n=1 Tax=Paraburkholderia sp. BR10872 TaxID=3236989 RepID=UPI0034D1B206